MMEAMSTARSKSGEESWKPLHIGVVLGGRTDAAVTGEIHRLRQCVDHTLDQLTSSDNGAQAAVMVQFHVPGDVVSPDFQGMRIGSWIGNQRCQIVQVAVPADLHGLTEVAHFLALNLEWAVRVAAGHVFRWSSHLSTSQAAIVASHAAFQFQLTNR